MISLQISILLLSCGITKKMACFQAYDLFIKCYNKNFNLERMQIFCYYYEHIKSCKNCNITSVLDYRYVNRKATSKIQILGLSSEMENILELCQQIVCSLRDVLPDLQEVYKSVDLTEAHVITEVKNQLQCGMCWAFGTVCALENSVLLNDQAPIFWMSQQLNISELFLGVNTRGKQEFCAGGDFYNAINYMNATNQTIETADNFFYDQQNIDLFKTYFQQQLTVTPKISSSNEFQPFALFTVTGTNVSIPLISLHYYEQSPDASFNTSVISKIKGYLSRGIVVVGGMHVQLNENKFATYSSGVLEETCPNYKLDHQIVFVGYGRKEGKDVWMLRNSYGTLWGVNGYFYVPIGTNSFCTEMEATLIIPKQFKDGLFENIGDHSKRESWQLDKDDNSLILNDGSIEAPTYFLSSSAIVGIAVGILLIITTITLVLCQIISKGNKTRGGIKLK
uniref:Cathepsin L n=1 Tax=Trepomonas sp. PC1 TaxID=1076344 RepID=A0A146KD06_9EUKA|eukprot:JAP93565.1 Cathepsin L [Trepomonas sp. PC1]